MKRLAILAITLSCLVVLLCLAPGIETAWAQSSWVGGNDNWNNPSDWSPVGVPNSSTTDVSITNGSSGTPTTVFLNISPSIQNLTLDSFNTLSFNQGTVLTVYGTSISNAGQITINGGGGYNTFLVLDNSVTLSGTGTLTMTVGGGGGNTYIEQGAGGLTLTNQSTIQGAGVIGNGGLALNNSGTVNANSSGQTLQLNGSGGITNTNLLEASSGGYLQLNEVSVNNAGGNITANSGSTVQLFGSSIIQGGTLTNNGGAFFGTPAGNTATLYGSTGAGAVTINGTYTSDLNTATFLLGTINNQGNLQVNGGAGANTILQIYSNVTLQGGGTVTLSTASGGGSAFIDQSSGLTLTNVNNTIQGAGIIGYNGLTIVNTAGGTINANSTGVGTTTTLALQYVGSPTNAGLMEATNNGLLLLNGSTWNNAGGTITASGSGASVQFAGSVTIQGGTLTNNGGAFFGTLAGSTATLDGSTNGPITLNGTYTSDLNTTIYILGTINNNNNLQVNGGAGYNSILVVDSSNVMLQGGGTLTLHTGNGGGNAIVEAAVSGLTLTNVNNTIQGEGILGGLTIINQAGGTINANSTGGGMTTALTIEGATVTNAGLMEASNNGVLNLYGVLVNNAGGTIMANPGASVQFFGSADIQGGTLTNNGAAFFGTPSGYTATLDGSTQGLFTLNGTYTSDYNTVNSLLGTINNQGNFLVNGGAGYNTFLLVDSSNVILQGGGTVTLSTASGGGNAIIEQAAGGLTLENVDNTIQGAGYIGGNGLSVVNDAAGTIQANVNGQTLTLNGSGSLTNNGTLAALGGGTLNVTPSMPLTNYNAGTNTLTGGTYSVDGTGGASTMILPLGTTGGEIVNNAANIILNGTNANVAFVDTAGLNLLSNLAANTTLASSLAILNGYNLTTPGDFANAGTVTVGNASTLKIGATGTNTYTQSGGLTQGTGNITGHVVINGGTIKPGDPPGTLSVFDLTLNNGTFLEQIAGSGQYGVLDVTGGNAMLGSNALLNIDLLGHYDPVGHLFTILNDTGGSVSGTFANAPASGFAMDGINWTIAYNSNDIVLDAVSHTVIPIPGSVWLTLSGLAGLWGMRRFRA